MDEFRVQRVIAALRRRGVDADLYQENGVYGVRVSPGGDRTAELDANRTTEPDGRRSAVRLA
jgi:hypothetical protein